MALSRIGETSKWVAVALVVGGLSATQEASASNFTLQGKTVQVLVSGGVGGGLDSFARVIMPYLSKNLPGEPTMVAQNLPGGGGVQGVQRLYNVSTADGTSIGTTPAGPIKEPLMGNGQVNYDLRRFHWIGSLTFEDTACVVWNTSPIKNLEDAKFHQVNLSATGAASNSTLGPLLMNDLFGTKFKPISGYDGGTSMLAVERGEVDGRCSTMGSIRTAQPHWINDKMIRVIISMSDVKDPDFPDAPHAKDLLKTEADKQALEFFQAPDEIQDPWMLPPDTPPEVVAVYRQAFDKTVKDPVYLADAAKRMQNVAPRSGAEVQAIIEEMYKTPPAVIERVKKATTVAKAQ